MLTEPFMLRRGGTHAAGRRDWVKINYAPATDYNYLCFFLNFCMARICATARANSAAAKE